MVQIKEYICIDYPRCPDNVKLPFLCLGEPEHFFIITPPNTRTTRHDYPLVNAKIRNDFLLTQPVYHKGFVLMQAKHNDMKPLEIDMSVFDYMNDGTLEHCTLYQIIENINSDKNPSNQVKNLQLLVRCIELCPSMLDLFLEYRYQYELMKHKDLMIYKRDSRNLLSCIINNIDFKLPKAFIIHLESRPDRLQRMEQRMKSHNMEYQIVQAIHYEDIYITQMGMCADHLNINRIYNRKAQFACYYSHLKAIRQFYESGENMGFIFEDDCTFRKDFDHRIKPVIHKLNDMKNFNLCSLLVSNEDFYRENNNKFNSLIKLDNRAWGMVGYIISRDYAKYCLDNFDKPLLECPHVPGIPNYVTSEIIPMYSRGWATSLALVMDELGPSTICEQNADIHKNIFAFHGLDNFEIPESY